jgi:hypothetical protein
MLFPCVSDLTPRTPEADESLATLLARSEQVRAKQTAPTVEPSPALFRPQTPVVLPTKPESPAPQEVESQSVAEAARPPGEPTSTTSRLLEAKRRAQRREKQEPHGCFPVLLDCRAQFEVSRKNCCAPVTSLV